jgi:hypothetical protein
MQPILFPTSAKGRQKWGTRSFWGRASEAAEFAVLSGEIFERRSNSQAAVGLVRRRMKHCREELLQ